MGNNFITMESLNHLVECYPNLISLVAKEKRLTCRQLLDLVEVGEVSKAEVVKVIEDNFANDLALDYK